MAWSASNAIFDFCKRALLNPRMELLLVLAMKGGLQDLQIPAGPLVIIKPAAIDFSITFLLKSSTLSEAGVEETFGLHYY